MTPSWNEAPVSLEKLDGHLKALLRLKIREFVHLSPWFKDTPTVDPSLYAPQPQRDARRVVFFAKGDDCPHSKNHGRHGRRHVRSAVHLTRAI